MISAPDPPNGHEPEVPPWFTNHDEEVVVEQEDPLSLRQRVVIAAAVLVIVVLLLIPILQAILLERRQNDLPDEQFQRTALQFTSAVFFARSAGQAMIFADRDARADVENVVQYFRDLPPNSARARVQVGVTPCPREWQSASVCFRGTLFDPSTSRVPPIAFGLADGDDGPEVVYVQIDLVTAGTQPASRW